MSKHSTETSLFTRSKTTTMNIDSIAERANGARKPDQPKRTRRIGCKTILEQGFNAYRAEMLSIAGALCARALGLGAKGEKSLTTKGINRLVRIQLAHNVLQTQAMFLNPVERSLKNKNGLGRCPQTARQQMTSIPPFRIPPALAVMWGADCQNRMLALFSRW